MTVDRMPTRPRYRIVRFDGRTFDTPAYCSIREDVDAMIDDEMDEIRHTRREYPMTWMISIEDGYGNYRLIGSRSI